MLHPEDSITEHDFRLMLGQLAKRPTTAMTGGRSHADLFFSSLTSSWGSLFSVPEHAIYSTDDDKHRQRTRKAEEEGFVRKRHTVGGGYGTVMHMTVSASLGFVLGGCMNGAHKDDKVGLERLFSDIMGVRSEDLDLRGMQLELDRGYKGPTNLQAIANWNGRHRGTHPRTRSKAAFPFTFGHPEDDRNFVDDGPSITRTATRGNHGDSNFLVGMIHRDFKGSCVMLSTDHRYHEYPTYDSFLAARKHLTITDTVFPSEDDCESDYVPDANEGAREDEVYSVSSLEVEDFSLDDSSVFASDVVESDVGIDVSGVSDRDVEDFMTPERTTEVGNNVCGDPTCDFEGLPADPRKHMCKVCGVALHGPCGSVWNGGDNEMQRVCGAGGNCRHEGKAASPESPPHSLQRTGIGGSTGKDGSRRLVTRSDCGVTIGRSSGRDTDTDTDADTDDDLWYPGEWDRCFTAQKICADVDFPQLEELLHVPQERGEYTASYTYEPKPGKCPDPQFTGGFACLNEYCRKLTEDQGTKDWFLMRRFLISSTVAVNIIRTVQKMKEPGVQLKENADTLCGILQMRIVEEVPPAVAEETDRFIAFIRGLGADAGEWENGRFDGAVITVARHLKPALSRLGIAAPGGAKKADLARLLASATNTAVSSAPSRVIGAVDIQRCALQKWFMQPLKQGGGDSKAMKQGLANEAHIASMLHAHFNAVDQSHQAERLAVVDVIKVGLVESKNYPRIGSSVDCLALVDVICTTTGRVRREVACVEIKTKGATRTIANQQSKITTETVKRSEWVSVLLDDTTTHSNYQRCVDDSSHRVQCLHHAATTGRQLCIYVVAEWRRITRTVVCCYKDSVRLLHMQFLRGVWMEHLSVFESTKLSLKTFENVDLGYVGNEKDLAFAVSLTNGLRTLVEERGVMRTAKQILPTLVAFWNATKGGVDVTSRYLKDSQCLMERALPPTTRMYVKGLKLCLLNAFMLHRVALAFPEWMAGSCTSHKKMRRRLNALSTFPDFLVDAVDSIGSYVLPGGDDSLFAANTTLATVNTPGQSQASDTEDNGSANKIKRPGTTKAKFRQAFQRDETLRRCRLAAKWWKLDGTTAVDKLHRHEKIAIKNSGTRCVLCCRLCFDVRGNIILRSTLHDNTTLSNGRTVSKDHGRKGHNASCKCSVCGVHLCDSKSRFPGGVGSCWDRWHSEPDLINGKTKTLCHIADTRSLGTDVCTVIKKAGDNSRLLAAKSSVGATRGQSRSSSTPTEPRASERKSKRLRRSERGATGDSMELAV